MRVAGYTAVVTVGALVVTAALLTGFDNPVGPTESPPFTVTETSRGGAPGGLRWRPGVGGGQSIMRTSLFETVAWSASTLVGTTLYVRDREKIVALDLGAD